MNEKNEFEIYVGKVLATATKLKNVMQKKNIAAARAKCPHCTDGFIHGRLNGRKNHLWMKCDDCSVFMME